MFSEAKLYCIVTVYLFSCVTAVSGQIEAIRKGLTQVVPQAAFELFTWQEVEKRICGDSQITMTLLRQSSETILL